MSVEFYSLTIPYQGEKVLVCSVCKKKFTTKQALLHHVVVHTGEKPFQVIQCTLRSDPSYPDVYIVNQKLTFFHGDLWLVDEMDTFWGWKFIYLYKNHLFSHFQWGKKSKIFYLSFLPSLFIHFLKLHRFTYVFLLNVDHQCSI